MTVFPFHMYKLLNIYLDEPKTIIYQTASRLCYRNAKNLERTCLNFQNEIYCVSTQVHEPMLTGNCIWHVCCLKGNSMWNAPSNYYSCYFLKWRKPKNPMCYKFLLGTSNHYQSYSSNRFKQILLNSTIFKMIMQIEKSMYGKGHDGCILRIDE